MSDLHLVADHLAAQAKSSEGSAADAFGRSAFNRYYYASFLTVRELLMMIDPKWASQSHASIPSLLTGALVEKLRTIALRQMKRGVIDEQKRQNLVAQARIATSEIANALSVAYGVRVAADYQPEKPVVFDLGHFRLESHTSSEARGWKLRVEKQKSTLLHVWKELGIV